ncbi:type II toxin-antitoxin system HicB family antitoxin [Endozoicomonas sp. ALE010]|uniref:type II toxin-antitoxin system HicB family antitoxin n=1 Tax=Endozoicomonas sp. ALE010 TaxID=3403081 RepID=UPI003BB72F83
MNTMTHKGYSASLEYSDDDECFVGHIAGIKDRVGFHGESVAELKNAFQEAVEDYLETCAVVGKEPQQPYSGKLTLRIPPELHASIATAAQVSGQSINQWISSALSRASRI